MTAEERDESIGRLGGSHLRVLLVAMEWPWPPTNGYRLRLGGQIEALAGVVDLDVVAMVRPGEEVGGVPDGVHLNRVERIARPPESSTMRWLPRWFGSALPRRLARLELTATRRRLTELFGDVDYDIIWSSHIDAYMAGEGLSGARLIVDFDNLESWVIAHRRKGLSSAHGRVDRSLLRRARVQLSLLIDRFDERRWRKTEATIAQDVDTAVLCSGLDAHRLGVGHRVVIANSLHPPADVQERAAVDPDAPRLLFVGMMTYEPNVDAVVWFAHEVLPLILTAKPGATFRVVGDPGPSGLDQISSLPGVDVVGRVPSVGPELRRAAVEVVPLRFGGGTRLKIVEALGSGVPVVSTTVGAEGLEVESGRDLLIADTPQELAEAVVRLVDRPDVRAGVVERGLLTFQRHYAPVVVAEQIRATLAT